MQFKLPVFIALVASLPLVISAPVPGDIVPGLNTLISMATTFSTILKDYLDVASTSVQDAGDATQAGIQEAQALLAEEEKLLKQLGKAQGAGAGAGVASPTAKAGIQATVTRFIDAQEQLMSLIINNSAILFPSPFKSVVAAILHNINATTNSLSEDLMREVPADVDVVAPRLQSLKDTAAKTISTFPRQQ